MEELRKVKEETYNHLTRIPPKYQVRSHFSFIAFKQGKQVAKSITGLIIPSKCKKPPRKPKTQKRRETYKPKHTQKVRKVGTSLKCSNCQKNYHNQRTCTYKGKPPKGTIANAYPQPIGGKKLRAKPIGGIAKRPRVVDGNATKTKKAIWNKTKGSAPIRIEELKMPFNHLQAFKL